MPEDEDCRKFSQPRKKLPLLPLPDPFRPPRPRSIRIFLAFIEKRSPFSWPFIRSYLLIPPSLPLGSCPPGKSAKKGTLLCPTRDSIIPKKPLTADRSPKRTVSYGVSFVTTNRPGPEPFRVLQWPADVVRSPNLLSKTVDASSLRRRDGRTIVARASLEER